MRPQWVTCKLLDAFNEDLGENWPGYNATTVLKDLAADALVMQGVMASATMVLSMQNEEVEVFHEDSLQLPAPSQ